MVRMIGILFAAATALAPAVAQAADWWWVAGEPGSQDVWFVDTDSIAGNGPSLSFQVLRIAADRSNSVAQGEDVNCDRASRDAVQRFVCATPQERLSLGAMLGPISPEVAATAIFDAPPVQTAKR